LKKIILLLILITFWASSANAQSKSNKRVNSYNGNWSFGVGVNVVDDSGTKLKDFFNTSENWNTSSPYTVNVEYYADNQFSFVATASMNKYSEGKNIDSTSVIIKEFEPDYLAIDVSSRFYFGDLFSNYSFDPYVFLGFGYTKIGAYKSQPFPNALLRDDIDHILIDDDGNFDVPEIGRITINAGVGFNYWFAQTTWGFNLNLASKVGMASGEFKTGPNSVSNQMQYSFGLIYFLKN